MASYSKNYAPFTMVIYGIWIVLNAIASVGMLWFKNWARYLYLLCCVSAPLMPLFYWSSWIPVISWQDGLGWVDQTMQGVIVSLAFFSVLKDRFNSKHNACQTKY